jgi:hypothetical protein
MKVTLGVLFAIAFILELGSAVAANSGFRTVLQVQSASNWQYSAGVASASSQVFDRHFLGTGQL